MFVDLDYWTINQLHRCARVFDEPQVYTNLTLTYDSRLDFTTITPDPSFIDWDKFFGNSDPTFCGVSGC